MELKDLLLSALISVLCGLSYASVLLRRLCGHKHALGWPVDLEMLAEGFKVSIAWGNLHTLHMLLGFMAQPWLMWGLRVQRIQPPGCEPCFWLSLKSSPCPPPPSCSSSSSTSSSVPDNSASANQPQRQQQQRPEVLLCYVHGGAFVGGDPIMCGKTLQRWMNRLRQQGTSSAAICISYPLAPERPFPAAVASTAAAFAWVGQQYPAGCGTTVIAVGDSAGGNITATSLAALRDYYSMVSPGPTTPATLSPAGDVAGHDNSTGTAADAPVSLPTIAPSSSSSSRNVLTAAIEAHLFADLHNRLVVMAADSGSGSSSSSSIVVPIARMPSAIILVSPCTDISPSACFRSANRLQQPSSAAAGTSAATAGTTVHISSSNISSSTTSPNKKPHYDYLPENIESGGMGSYAAHHEQLAGPYASPVLLPKVEGLCAGRIMLLAGGVELLAADIARFAAKLKQELGPSRVVYHVEPLLPHSWAVLPTPSMAPKQQVVVAFIAAEHAAAKAAQAATATAAKAVTAGGGDAGV